ncbi:MAG TPA: hypothetical protein VNK44_06305 [Candidatus Nitrosotenuis sp.]|nr:hypothetical protein [Candidatus Nitrosotenuis sp.]
MDKNPVGTDKIRKLILSSPLGSISFENAITKTYFFHKVAAMVEIPVVYFDFDLLYSGYLAANILQQHENTTVHQPREDTWKKLLAETLDQISQKRHLVMIDSLNGFFTVLADQKNAGKLINNALIMLASMGQRADSTVLVGSISKYKKDEGWVLSAIGRHIVEVNGMNHFTVRRLNSALHLTLVDDQNFTKSSIDLSELDLV